MISLGSDTMAPAFPEVLDAIARANVGEEFPYQRDSVSQRVFARFNHLFGHDVTVRFAFGGTGANVLAIVPTVQRQEAIVLADIAHMVKHECGAVTQATGAQFHIVPTTRAKMSLEVVRTVLTRAQHPHISRPAVISLTQATEEGTVYSVDEIRAIAELAHANEAYVHVDGARLANAVAALGVTVAEMLVDTGVDVVSFGGTKAGAMYGDAAVFIEPRLSEDLHRQHIATGQLAAKSRFVAAQFDALLTDDLWLRGAENANEMARHLRASLQDIDGFDVRPGDVNMVFVSTTEAVAQNMLDRLGLHPYDVGTTTFRWITAWNTTKEDVANLVETLKGCTGTN